MSSPWLVVVLLVALCAAGAQKALPEEPGGRVPSVLQTMGYARTEGCELWVETRLF